MSQSLNVFSITIIGSELSFTSFLTFNSNNFVLVLLDSDSTD